MILALKLKCSVICFADVDLFLLLSFFLRRGHVLASAKSETQRSVWVRMLQVLLGTYA